MPGVRNHNSNLFLRFLAALIFFELIGSVSANVSAAEMPEGAKSAMGRILTQEKFQPRSVPESWWSRVKGAAREWAMAKIGEALDFLRQLSERLAEDDTAASRFLRHVADVLGPVVDLIGKFLAFVLGALSILTIAAVIAAAAAAVRLFRARSSRRGSVKTGASGGSNPPDLSPFELLRDGMHIEALAALRKILRRQLQLKYQKDKGTTDREFVCRLLGDNNTDGTFTAVSALFEKAAFARREVRREAVAEIIERLRTKHAGGAQ